MITATSAKLREVSSMSVICDSGDLIPNAGVCALIGGDQVAIFYLPDSEQKVFAISNYDPFGRANVLSRGIVGSLNGRVVVASPLLKQHFDLSSGRCLEDETVAVKTYSVELVDNQVVAQVVATDRRREF